MPKPLLALTGLVEREATLSLDDLRSIDSKFLVLDVSQIDPKRKGTAIRLAGLLDMVGAKPEATYLGLHASKDDFHASVPLDAVRERGLVIFELDGQPLSESAGGPVRFTIPDSDACKTSEIDECANVKFVDRIELTQEKGFDNRPSDDEEHEALHEAERDSNSP